MLTSMCVCMYVCKYARMQYRHKIVTKNDGLATVVNFFVCVLYLSSILLTRGNMMHGSYTQTSVRCCKCKLKDMSKNVCCSFSGQYNTMYTQLRNYSVELCMANSLCCVSRLTADHMVAA
jgi:hypothetical protein